MPHPAAALLPCLLLLSLPQPSAAEYLSQLPAPQNVTLYSYNLQNFLRWAPVETHSGSVLYTVQRKICPSSQWEEVNCTNITKTECSVTYSSNGHQWTFVLRVRAQLGQMQSDWVETGEFEPHKSTTVGPLKEINVTSAPNSLILAFRQPFEEDNGISYFTYCVRYWEKLTENQHEVKCTTNTHVVLQNLKQLTWYCLQIETSRFEGNAGSLSEIHCYRTTAGAAARAGFLFLIFFGVIVVVMILIVVCYLFIQKFHKAVKYWSQPPFKLPLHIEEYLKDPEMPALDEWQNNHDEDNHWDSVSVVSSAEGSHALVRNNLHTNVHSDNRAMES
uniref:Interferon gamma receptor 2 n=1 Tax=Pelusios castaneus TaxID=367368 RepID=A0A8C8SGX1_9SAUR